MLIAAGVTAEGGWVLAKLDMIQGNSTVGSSLITD